MDDIRRTSRGQYSTQNPHPLHRSSIIITLPLLALILSRSRGFLQYFMQSSLEKNVSHVFLYGKCAYMSIAGVVIAITVALPHAGCPL